MTPTVTPPVGTEYLDARLSSAVQDLSTPDVVAPLDVDWIAGLLSAPNALAVPSPQTADADATPFPNPLGQWSGIVTEAVANLTLLAQLIASNPAPILQQMIQNQLGYGQTYAAAIETVVRNAITLFTPGAPGGVFTNLQTMAQQFAAGDIQAGFSTVRNTMMSLVYQLGMPMLPTIYIPVSMARNFANAVELLPTFAVTAGLGAVSLIGTTISTMGQSGQAIADAVKAGDPVAAIGAVLSTPGDITQTVVNGWMGFGGGLIGPNGLVTNLLKFRDTVAGALGADGAEAAPAVQQLLSNVEKAVDTGRSTILTETIAPKADATGSADMASAPAEAPQAIESSTTSADLEAPKAQPTEEPKTVDEVTDSTSEAAKPTVRNSLVAVPGKLGSTPAATKPAAKAASDVRDGISATAKNIGEDVKKAFAKPAKQAKAEKSDAGAGSSGDAK
ncbi:hypothetical protein [Mycobacterium sp. NPDC050441]|uniref:hypothetical protein n=1 Tax=Mycobacterium sp. NPDC050441 TaxID=3155403 RepID=UPI0033CD8BF6